MSLYRVFVRNWWKPATRPGWPGGREPGPGRKSYRGHPRNVSYEEADAYRKQWNATHAPGPWSRKAEVEEI